MRDPAEVDRGYLNRCLERWGLKLEEGGVTVRPGDIVVAPKLSES